jgi:exopolysaccharide production protein ExoY
MQEDALMSMPDKGLATARSLLEWPLQAAAPPAGSVERHSWTPLGHRAADLPRLARAGFPDPSMPLDGSATQLAPLGGVIKRALDVSFALVALILFAPMMLIVAALVRISIGAPIFFAHERVGFGGRSFVCFKFRTMVANADEVLRRHLAENPEAAQEWRETRKLQNDPRVNCLGNILRKSSLDELPQLFNVLRGDMSLVGPRPVVSNELMRYGRHIGEYLKARPGMTGIWQTSGRNGLTYSTRVRLDRYYVRNWSIWLDLFLMMKTLPAVFDFKKTA